MFVFLSKFLPLFVYPVGLTCLLLVLTLILHQRARLRNGLAIAALAVLLLSSNRLIATSLVRSLEWQYFPPDPVPQADVIIVLGGGTEPAQAPRLMVQVNGAGSRVLVAADLYKQGIAPHILLSGGNIDWLGALSSTPAADMAGLLQLTGIPADALWLESQSQNTAENARYSARLLREKFPANVKPVILLVTSAQHMPRSVLLFRQAGLTVIPVPSDYSVTRAGWDDLFRLDLQAQLVGLLPSSGNLSATTNAMKEYIGLWTATLFPAASGR